MDFVMSPGGIRFPRTPNNVAAYEKINASNEKVIKNAELKKDEKVAKDEEGVKAEEDVKDVTDDDDGKNAALEWYRVRMNEMEMQMKMMEKLMDDNERESTSMIEKIVNEERELRRELEERLMARDDKIHEEDVRMMRRERDMVDRERRLDVEKEELRVLKTKPADQPAFKSTLSISDPAGDVVGDLSACLRLDALLKNTRSSVTTVASLLDDALTRHASLSNILLNDEDYSNKFVVSRFKNKFSSLYAADPSTLSVIAILVMETMSASKTRSAVKFAASVDCRVLKRAVPAALADGSVPSVGDEEKVKTLTDLMGVKQLQSWQTEAEIEEHWGIIESVISAVVCLEKNVKKKLSEAKRKLEEFNATVHADVGEAIAKYETLFDACTSWLGTVIEGDYNKIQRFLSKCSGGILKEYAEFVSPTFDGHAVDELTMEWDEFTAMIKKVWNSVEMKDSIRVGFGWVELDNNAVIKQPRMLALPVPAVERDDAGLTDGRPGVINCSKCQKIFFPSATQVVKNKEMGIPLPTECPKCKDRHVINLQPLELVLLEMIANFCICRLMKLTKGQLVKVLRSTRIRVDSMLSVDVWQEMTVASDMMQGNLVL
jgi:hypothetical protein